MARTKRRQPYNPNSPVHDRRSKDLLRNARVAPVEVDDPFEEGAKLIVMRSTRDPLENLYARRSIDDAQYAGGRSFQDDHECTVFSAKAIDPSQPYVDCSLRPRGISTAFSEALARLKVADGQLGQEGSAIARDVLVHGLSMEAVGQKRRMTKEPELKYLGRRFRECLDTLAFVYGHAMEKRS